MAEAASRVHTERTQVSLSDFMAEIQSLESGNESINMLVYGDSNAGKTVLAGTLPGKVLWLAGEPGYKSAFYHGATGKVRRIPDTATALTAVDFLRAKNRYRQLDWIVIDGLSTMEKRFRLGYAQEAFDLNPTKRAHRNLPDKPDYFNTQNFLITWIPLFVDMGVNLLITAHAYRTDKTDNGDLVVFPGIQGKVTETANAISGLMDITAYYEARRVYNKAGDSKVIRRMFFETPPRRNKNDDDIRYICGDKFGVLGTHMDFPTMPAILAKISGEER